MVAIIQEADPPPGRRWAPDRYERVLSVGAVLLFVAVSTALVRGRAHWGEVIAPVWLHLATVMVALVLTPTMLLRPRGDRWHRRLGWVWAVAMFATAALSFLVRQSNYGGLSLIHILSAYTIVQVPLIVWFARTHNIRRHRRGVRAMVTGALLIAGFFTFPFGRMLGTWLSG